MKQTVTKTGKKPDSMWSGGVLQHAAVHTLLNNEPPLTTSLSRPLQLQAKLKIGAPKDQYEQEADRIADAVVSRDLIPKSISTTSTTSLQRLRREAEKSKEDKLEELLEKLAEAALKTPQFKQILDRLQSDTPYKRGKEFAGTLPGVLSIGTLTAGMGAAVAAALVDASEELPIQIPEIPLGGGHSVKLTINGPLDEPSDWSIAYTFTATSDESSPETSAETKIIGTDLNRLNKQNEYNRAHTHIVHNSSETLTERTARVHEDSNVDRFGRRTIQTTIPSFGDQKPKSELQLTQPTSSFGYKPQKPLIGESLKLNSPSERKKREEDTTLQRKSNNAGTFDSIPPIVHDVISSAGQPLDTRTRSFMEKRFGHDFSKVRVHTNEKAAESARAVNAHAYTVGQNVVFGAGQYAPGSSDGRRLMAHELVHVGQQVGTSRTRFGQSGDKRGLSPKSLTVCKTGADVIQRQAVAGAGGAGQSQVDYGSGGHRGMGSASADDIRKQREMSAGPTASYSETKDQIYQQLISQLRSLQKYTFDGLRDNVREAPLSPHLKPIFNSLIGILEELVGVLITLLLAVIGILVGAGEAAVGLVTGIARLILGVSQWIALLMHALLGRPERFETYNRKIVSAARNLLPAFKTFVDAWIDRYRQAPIDRGTIMIGELTGQIIVFLATLGTASAKVGQVPRLSLQLTAPIRLATPGGQVLALPAGVISVNVADPVLAMATVAVVGSMASGGGPQNKDPFDTPITEEEVEKAFEPVERQPSPEQPSTTKKQLTKAHQGRREMRLWTRGRKLEDIVDQAIANLKSRGIKGLRPTDYGRILDQEVTSIVSKYTGKAQSGWSAGSNQELNSIIRISPNHANLTVRQYMRQWGMGSRYPKFPKDFLDQKIGRLRPDIYVKGPDGRALVWDLTSEPTPQHIYKTMFYTEVIGKETGGFFRIGESYWREIIAWH